ncbi:hypothetical protein HAX54_032644, partial [Datura stramonium]|nr:hypothetical protein [Datura stramonium]
IRSLEDYKIISGNWDEFEQLGVSIVALTGRHSPNGSSPLTSLLRKISSKIHLFNGGSEGPSLHQRSVESAVTP